MAAMEEYVGSKEAADAIEWFDDGWGLNGDWAEWESEIADNVSGCCGSGLREIIKEEEGNKLVAALTKLKLCVTQQDFFALIFMVM